MVRDNATVDAHMDMLHPSQALHSVRSASLMYLLHILAWASALPSNHSKAMREASESRMAIDTDSYAFLCRNAYEIYITANERKTEAKRKIWILTFKDG